MRLLVLLAVLLSSPAAARAGDDDDDALAALALARAARLRPSDPSKPRPEARPAATADPKCGCPSPCRCGASGGCGCDTVAGTPPIAWVDDYDAGYAEAERTGKPALLFFTNPATCKYCREMERGHFRDVRVRAAFAGFVCIKVDTGTPAGGRLADACHVDTIPRVLVYPKVAGSQPVVIGSVPVAELLAKLPARAAQAAAAACPCARCVCAACSCGGPGCTAGCECRTAPAEKAAVKKAALGAETRPAAAPGDLHSHTCSAGHTWWHRSGDPAASHNCPVCGRYQNVVDNR